MGVKRRFLGLSTKNLNRNWRLDLRRQVYLDSLNDTDYLSANEFISENFVNKEMLEKHRQKERLENIDKIIAECHGDSILKGYSPDELLDIVLQIEHTTYIDRPNQKFISEIKTMQKHKNNPKMSKEDYELLFDEFCSRWEENNHIARPFSHHIQKIRSRFVLTSWNGRL